VEQAEVDWREAVLEETQFDQYRSLAQKHQLDLDGPRHPDSTLLVQASLVVSLHCMSGEEAAHTHSGTRSGVEVVGEVDWAWVSRPQQW
jgi:hypothetical protein